MGHGIQIAWQTVVKMVDGFFALLPNLIIAVCVFCAFFIVGSVIAKAVFGMAKRANMDHTLANAMGKLSAVCINVFGLLVCFVIVVPSFSPDKLIAGLGITSVAIGFAFQNILQNFFAGLLVLWQKPFGIGDEIKTHDFEGVVEDITIRSTILRTYSGQRVFIPNGMLLTDPVIVHTAYANRQVHIQIPVGAVEPGKALEVARTTLNGVTSISKDPPPEIFISAVGGTSSLDIYFWAASKNVQIIRATDEATYAMQQALTQYATPMPKAA